MNKIIRYYRRHGLKKFAMRATLRVWQITRKRLYIATRRRVVRSDYDVFMRSNWGDLTFEFCVNASYGFFLSDYLSKIQSPFIFLDVGANQGLYSLISAKNENCLSVVAFEPVASTFNFLTENIRLNGLCDRIRAMNVAVSSKSGTAGISIVGNHSGAASICLNPESGGAETEEIDLIEANEIKNVIPDKVFIVVKVDTEGHDEVVIGELAECAFFERVKVIFYEVDVRWTNASSIENTLRGRGFAKFLKIGEGKHYDIIASKDADELGASIDRR